MWPETLVEFVTCTLAVPAALLLAAALRTAVEAVVAARRRPAARIGAGDRPPALSRA